jgi:ribosomal protein L11 methyltransferase
LDSWPALDLRYGPGPASTVLQELLHAALDDFQPQAIAEHDTADGWRVFFRSTAQRDDAIAALRDRFGTQLRSVSAVDVPDENWARRSQEQLKAVRVGKVIVAPPWDSPNFDVRSSSVEVVVIDPSMGFGTGHHETTRLCLRLLQDVDVGGKRVIDVGTGSGVLALAAWRLGARSVTAVDADPDALLNARENIERNGAAAAIEVIESDLAALDVPPAGVVLANLTGAVLERHGAALLRLVAPAGSLIVSGFTLEETRGVVEALGAPQRSAIVEGSWAAILVRKETSA